MPKKKPKSKPYTHTRPRINNKVPLRTDDESYRTSRYRTSPFNPILIEITDLGPILQSLRTHLGISRAKFHKSLRAIGTQSRLIDIEHCQAEPPRPTLLRSWLGRLGITDHLDLLIEEGTKCRLALKLRLVKNDPCNPDMRRLIEAYREGQLTDYDRALLQLVARNK